MAVNKTITPLKTSATKVIPKGASQPPPFMNWMPSLHVSRNSHTANPTLITPALRLRIFWTVVFLQKKIKTMTDTSWIITGYTINRLFIFLLIGGLVQQDHRY